MQTNHEKDLQILKDIALKVKEIGGNTYFVGGYVRDKHMNIPIKDVDVEIFGVEPKKLEEILSCYGRVNLMGASFGILKIEGVEIDFSMPRKDINLGTGHKNFEVSVEPNMSTYEAARRRDFTINSILEDVLTGEIIDHFGGINDISLKKIEHVDEATFIEDELRVLRACQFAARFEFEIADSTIKLCKHIDLSTLPKERVFSELEKALLKAEKPSIFFDCADRVGALEKLFSPVDKLKGVPQNPQFHPEGDVYVHTMMVLDAAAKIKNESDYPLAVMFAALCHDFGKITNTFVKNGRIVSYGHEDQLNLTVDFLKKLNDNKDLIDSVKILVKNHMKPNVFANSNVGDKAIRELMVASTGRKVSIKDLLVLSKADRLGNAKARDFEDKERISDWWKERLGKINHYSYVIRPVVYGRDFIELGVEPGVHLGEMVKEAFKLQISGLEREEIIKMVMGNYENK